MFPRYFDVTLPGDRYPALVEVATGREIELWEPHGWAWIRAHLAPDAGGRGARDRGRRHSVLARLLRQLAGRNGG